MPLGKGCQHILFILHTMRKAGPGYRNLTKEEIAQLERQGNSAQWWDLVFVREPFDPLALRNNRFSAEVLIGATEQGYVFDKANDFSIEEGITGCWIAACTIGDHCALHNVRIMQNFTVGNGCMLMNINEMSSTPEMSWMSPMNENGLRAIIPSPEMNVSDAYLWARYRGHEALQDKLAEMADNDLRKNGHAVIGDYAVIRNTSRLHNVVVLSSKDDPTNILNCTHLCHGVVGYGCRLQDGIIAQRFLLGEHVKLEYGLRLNDSVVGDNSTLARCEVGSSIIFPSHEQHHNSSFLIAALVEGQSNLAAGATVGSNHNSRTADGELQACRGFWPGLCTSLKHSSHFAAYCLLAKGDYPAELNIPLPFALVNNNAAKDQIEVMPAYWWMYNMFALHKFTTKFHERDHRVHRLQPINLDLWAPDVAEQMLTARHLLASWMAQAGLDASQYDLRHHPTEWRTDKTPAGLVVTATGLEHGSRREVILKPVEAYQAYERMLYHYIFCILGKAIGSTTEAISPQAPRITNWVNLGGQLLPQEQVEALIDAIEQGKVKNWSGVNARLCRLHKQHTQLWQAHALQLLHTLEDKAVIPARRWVELALLDHDTDLFIANQISRTRQKDDDDPFRHATCWDAAERHAVLPDFKDWELNKFQES